MAQPTAKQTELMRCIEILISEITGAAWNLPSEKQLRVRWFQSETLKGKRTLHLIRAGDVRQIEVTGGTIDKELDIFILAAHEHGKSDEDPHNQDPPTIEEMQDQLGQDLENKIRPAFTAGHPCLDALDFDVINIDMQDENREFFKEGWAILEVRLMALITHDIGEA